LLQEISECGVEASRLSIDPKTMIITDEDVKREKQGVSAMGFTGQGVGAAMSRRILGRFDSTPPLLARNVDELKPFIRDVVEVLDEEYTNGARILLEGTQGAALSLYHGFYPFVTSRDTTVAGCLSEAGIAWNKVRRVIYDM
jgi:adenylosuccinate synthase